MTTWQSHIQWNTYMASHGFLVELYKDRGCPFHISKMQWLGLDIFKQIESELWCYHTDKAAVLIVLSIKLIAKIEEP